MTTSLEGSPAKAKEAPSPHEVRLGVLDTNPVFQCLRDATITSLSELYFRFGIFIVGTNEKSDFYEAWQQHKLLKTLKLSQV